MRVRLVSLLLPLILLAGCGEVSQKAALKKIDNLLEEADVKRKEIESSIDALKKSVTGIRKAKIKAKTKAKVIEQKIAPVRERVTAIDNTLKEIRGPLIKKEPFKVGNKTYSPEELTKLADEILERRETLIQEIASYAKAQASLTSVIEKLETNQSNFQKAVIRLEAMMTEIDAKKIALDAMKKASEAMGNGETTLEENVAELEERINELYVDVETKLQGESEQWNESMLGDTILSLDKIESFVKSTQSSGDQVSKIDEILDKQ